MMSVAAVGQTASPASAVYRPGRYVPVRLEAAAAGVIDVTGDTVQGVEWPAPGKSTVVVPLLIYEDAGSASSLQLRVNGRPITIDLQPLGPADADPPQLLAFWKTVDPHPHAGPALDDDAYALATLWRPGPSAATVRWTLMTIAVIVLTLGIAAHADPKRRTRWLLLATAGLSAGLIAGFPAESPRRVLPAQGRPSWEWVWRAGAAEVEPWSPGLRYVPRSMFDAKAASPTLVCDASGRALLIRWRSRAVETTREVRAVLIRPGLTDKR